MPFINLQNKVTRFFITAGILYLSWFLLYELFVKRYTTLDAKVISWIITQAEATLHLFGYTTYRAVEEDNMQLLGIDGAHPVWIGAPCNAITLFAFFSLFVIAFPGPLRKKLWFIPLGIVMIHLVNILRVIALVMINFYAPEYLAFNHTYTFTVIVYAIIFAMWMFWVRLATRSAVKNAKES